jgi:hypothetical protein
VATEARNPKINEIMKRENKVGAVLDMETRWGSTFLMIDRMLRQRNTIDELGLVGNRKLQLTKSQWQQIQELRDMLYKCFLVTKKMQLEDLTPGYFFRKWTGLVLVVEDHGGLIATKIMESMKRREAELFGSSVFLAAVLADVFNMNLLSTDQKEVATEALIDLILRLKGLDEETDNATPGHIFINLSLPVPGITCYSISIKQK